LILKILQVSSAQSFGGGERHLADLANGLIQRGHEVHAALRPHSPLLAELNLARPEHITTMPLRNAFDVGSARRLTALVREQKIEIVHAHMARDYPLASYATRRNPNSKLIITRHVLFPLNRLHSITLSQVARIIAVSEAVGRQLSGHSRVPVERIAVVPNGVDIKRFESLAAKDERTKFRLKWAIPADDVLVGSVGAIKTLKGHKDFLRAAAVIRQRFPETKFLISGIDESRGGENQIELESLVIQLGLAGAFSIIGRVDDLTSLYAALDIFVSASHTESFGLAIAEAMASGVAVVATKTEGANEIIAHDQTGLLVPIKNDEALVTAIAELIADETKRRRLGVAGRRRIKDSFSLEGMIEKTERVYQQVLTE